MPIETASAPSASAFATSAPLRIPPETISCTLRCMPSSCSACDRDAHRGQRRDPDVLDEDVLRRGRAALHAVDDDDVRARLHRELHVVVRPRRADLDEDRLLPVGDLAQLVDLDLEVVRARPVRMAARRERWSIPFGSVRISATRSEILWPSSIPPPPGFAPWPTTTSIASALRRSSGFMP